MVGKDSAQHGDASRTEDWTLFLLLKESMLVTYLNTSNAVAKDTHVIDINQ
jgi:hypothetical protein